jgi:hypothetical protein
MNQAIPLSSPAPAGEGRRRVSGALAAGVVVLPGLFVWFLLRQGHSTVARVLGFAWFGVFLLIGFSPAPESSAVSPPLNTIKAQPSAQPEPIPSQTARSDERQRAERKYLAYLDLMLGDVRRDGLIRQEDTPKTTYEVALGTMGTVATGYVEDKKVQLSPNGKAHQATFRREYSAIQAKTFPRLRELFGKALGEVVWEHDVKVEVRGKGNDTLRLTGFWFASNGNIKKIMEAAHENALALRFRRVEFRAHKLDETTYYDLDPSPDTALATFSFNRWTPVDEQ